MERVIERFPAGSWKATSETVEFLTDSLDWYQPEEDKGGTKWKYLDAVVKRVVEADAQRQDFDMTVADGIRSMVGYCVHQHRATWCMNLALDILETSGETARQGSFQGEYVFSSTLEELLETDFGEAWYGRGSELQRGEAAISKLLAAPELSPELRPECLRLYLDALRTQERDLGGKPSAAMEESDQRLVHGGPTTCGRKTAIDKAGNALGKGDYGTVVSLWHEPDDEPALDNMAWVAALLGARENDIVDVWQHIDASPRSRSRSLVLALSRLLIGRGDWASVSAFVDSDDDEALTVAALGLALGTNASDEQRAGLRRRLESAADEQAQASWPSRLGRGDDLAWQEMLAGYFLKRVDEARIFEPLASETAFRGDVSYLARERLGMLCQASLIRALRQWVEDADTQRVKAALQQTVDTGMSRYIEYHLAKYLLTRLER
jgi:hypothetical protein